MKKYKIGFYNKPKNVVWFIDEIKNGHQCCFCTDGAKWFQYKIKNGIKTGIDKEFLAGKKNFLFSKYKKNNKQGIELFFRP